MTRFRFVERPTSIGATEREARIVVCDVAWTPLPSDPKDVLAIRRVFGAVTARHDLFDTALALLDSWADETGIADRLVVDDVTYWFRVRETMWRWLHDRLLWRFTLQELGALDGPSVVEVDVEEPALVDVAVAAGVLAATPTSQPEASSVAADHGREPSASPPRRTASRFGSIARRLSRFVRPEPSVAAAPPARHDAADQGPAFLDERLDHMAADTSPRVVVLTTPVTYQRVAAADVPRDPILGSVIDALEAAGIRVTLVAIGPDHRRDEDLEVIRADPRIIPLSWFRFRWRSPDDADHADAATAHVAEVIAGLPPFVVAGLDLTGAFKTALSDHLARIVSTDVRQAALIERLLAKLRPDGILLAQEAIRLPWLTTAHDRGVPTFAVQHGILYLGHPGYPHRRHAAVRRATTTFTFGSFERDMLLSRGAYRPDEVVVGGSPRLDLDAEGSLAGDGRDAIRTQLDVPPGHRLLVVSTVNAPFLQRAHLAPMLERLLGGPLPDVHVCFKLHPGERDDGPYRALLEGLAAAGGYQAPRMSVVRDVDLLGLLRAADAHLGLYSTVLTDAVAAGTMNLIAMTDARADILGYVEAGVAVPVRSREDVLAALASPTRPSAEARRAFLERHFQSGKAGPRIARSIVATIEAATQRPIGEARS